MTNEVEPEPDEPKIAALMRMLQTDAIEPDAAVLESLRIQAAAKFEEAERRTGLQTRPDTDSELPSQRNASSSIEVQSDGSSIARTGLDTRPAKIPLPTTTTQHTRSKPMITFLASRSLATIVAIVSAIALWFNLSPTSSALSSTPFSKVLSELTARIRCN